MRESPTRWIAIGALGALNLISLVRSGALTFQPPASVVSSSPQRDDERTIRLLREVDDLLSPSASLVILPRGPDFSRYDYLIALGQLPRRRILPARVLVGAAAPEQLPDFVAAPGGEFPDPRYRLVRRVPHGSLYGKIPL